MEKKMIKAGARRLGAALLALVLILAAVTPAKEVFAEGFSFGGISDAVKSVEEVPAAEAEPVATEAPVFSFETGKETADTELPAVTMPSAEVPQESQPAQMEDVESVGDTAETLNAADVTIEQGSSGTYSVSNAGRYSYSVSPSADIDFETSNNTVTITVGSDVAVGEYTVTYSRNGSARGTFTVEVVAPADDGEDTGGTGTGTGAVEETQKMSMDKVATARGDGTYDLSLSLSGSVGSQTNKAKVDVIFIVDNSNSMYPNRSTYMSQLKPAMKALITNLSTTNGDKIDARYAIAMFGTDSAIRQNFTTAATASSSIDGISQNYLTSGDYDTGGTNYQAGIYQGKQLLNTKRDGATTVVVFVTDGLPTYRGAPNMTNGTGSNDNGGYNIAAAVSEIGGMNCNYFYCIGIGTNFTTSGTTENTNMTKLTGAVNATTTGIYAAANGTVTELTNVFNSISAEVSTFLCSNVTITDTLSNVDGQLMVQVSDPSSVKVEVIKDGTTIAGPAASITLAATDSNAAATLTASYTDGVLKLDFPDEYQLEAGYTYKLHAVIEPTEKAYQEYRETGYTDTGDTGTGTHSGEKGFYCNESATVTYTYKGEAGTATYNHPVIQLHPGTLVINKQIVDMEVENLTGLTFPVTLTYPDGTVDTQEIPLDLFDYDEETGTYTFEVVGLSPNTTYTVTESGETVEKYNVATTVNGEEGKEASGSVAMDGTETVSFVNTYTVAVTNLTLDKNVTGNLGDWSKDFTFTVYVDGEVFGTYTLNHNTEVVIIEEIPIGSKVEIVESDNENYTVSATVDGATVTVTDSTVTIDEVGVDGHAVVFTNHYGETIETGIVMDSVPYVMMLLISGAAFFFVMLRKRMGYEG